jgi:hypothetical protein
MTLKRRVRSLDYEGQKVFIRPLTLGEYLQAEPIAKEDGRQMDFTKFIVSRAVVTEAGEQVYQGEGDPQLAELPLDLLFDLNRAIQNLSNAGTIESIEKN